MLDVMLDLETMGNGPDAAIIAIGATEFDLQNRALGRQFYSVIDLESAVKFGGVMDASTVLWWLNQSEDARKPFADKGHHVDASLMIFSNWLAQAGPIDELKIWGNGAGFDNVILASAYRRSGIQQPWQYRNDRCYRTLKGLYKDVKMGPRCGVHHNALDDAASQALHLLEIFKAMGEVK